MVAWKTLQEEIGNMSTLTTYAGLEITFIGKSPRMITGKKYKIFRDTLSFDADGEEYWCEFGYPETPVETREFIVVDERGHYRDFEHINFEL